MACLEHKHRGWAGECGECKMEGRIDDLESQLSTKDARIRELEAEYAGLEIIEVRVETDEDGGDFWASIPSRPACLSQGDTLPDLLRNLADAIESWDEVEASGDPACPEPENA